MSVLGWLGQTAVFAETDVHIFARQSNAKMLFPQQLNLYATAIFLENGLFLFRYTPIFGEFKLYYSFHVLFASQNDIPHFLKTFWYKGAVSNKITTFYLKGRDVIFEFLVTWDNWTFANYRFKIQDIRHPEDYKNLMHFYRYYLELEELKKRNL